MKKLLIIAGDPSGDLVASKLVAAIKKSDSSIQISGIGGAYLEKTCDRFLVNLVNQHALGFSISLKKILAMRNILNNVIEPEIGAKAIDAVILVDYYGFNSRVARLAKSKGLRVYYYVSPQFWASRPWRADKLKRYVDLFLCLFPFELDFYRRKQIAAQFVGHPLLDSLPKVSIDDPVMLRVEGLVGLLPGSRPEEIRRHLPVMVEACRRIHKACPGTRFVLFSVPHVHRDYYLDLIGKKKASFFIELIRDEDYEWRSRLDVAISASGMETLENALLGVPMVVMYKTNWITYIIARCLIQIPFLGMPNLLAGREVVPEFIQLSATARRIAAPVVEWLRVPEKRLQTRRELLLLRQQFGEGGASDRAARLILDKVAA
jgi:lipid-A-disaccharide synthase